MSRASLDKAPQEVAAMFDDVAARYDITNDVLSLGMDRAWRRAVARAVDPRPGLRVLDLAAGTGTSSEPFARDGALVVPADFSLGMLRAGRRRRPDLAFTAVDALRLPFADHSFDAVTMSFGLRNVCDVDAALRELLRVTRPGGRLLVCEFSHPRWAAVRRVYLDYLMRAMPVVARAVSSNPDSYVYLAESIQRWPGQRDLAARIEGAGWTAVAWRDLTGGIVALHRGTAPGGAASGCATGAGEVDSNGQERTPPKELTGMGLDDKMNNATEDMQGKAKEAAGKVTDNERLEAEGRGDQTKADAKQAGEKVKDVFKN